MPNQPTRVIKAVSKVPSVHMEVGTLTLIRGTRRGKLFNLHSVKMAQAGHFDGTQKD